MPTFSVPTKGATLCCSVHGEESVHSNEGLCKVSRMYTALLKYYHMLKMELSLIVSSKLEQRTIIRYFTALGQMASNI